MHVRVSPGARRTHVGGRYGDGDPPVLVVRVTAPAVDGRANRAAVRAVAAAFGVRRSRVALVTGVTGRHKVMEVAGTDPRRLDRLLES